MTTYDGGDLFDALYGPMDGRTVRLVPLAPSHLDALDAGLRSDPEAMAHMLSAAPATRADTEALLGTALADRSVHRRCPFAVESPAGELLGTTSYLALDEAHGRVEIGWTVLFPAARGTSANPEMKLLMLARAFACGLTRVTIQTDERNARSRAAIAKLGATFEGVLRAYQRRADGRLRDTAVYAVTARDWPAVRARLESRLAAAQTA